VSRIGYENVGTYEAGSFILFGEEGVEGKGRPQIIRSKGSVWIGLCHAGERRVNAYQTSPALSGFLTSYERESRLKREKASRGLDHQKKKAVKRLIGWFDPGWLVHCYITLRLGVGLPKRLVGRRVV